MKKSKIQVRIFDFFVDKNCIDSLETAVRIEENAVAAIKAYTQLLHTGVISDADFFEIKAALLSCAVEE